MIKFLNNFFTLLLFLLAIGLFYCGVTIPFSTALINFLLIFTSIYTLLNACGRADKALGLGRWADKDDKDNPPSSQEK